MRTSYLTNTEERRSGREKMMKKIDPSRRGFFCGVIIVPCVFFFGAAIAGEVSQSGLDEETRTAQVFKLIKDKNYQCLKCHDVDKRVVGPAWREVAYKRKSNKWATALLAYKISQGSVGEYEQAESMPHNDVDEKDVTVIVDWILSLAK